MPRRINYPDELPDLNSVAGGAAVKTDFSTA